MSSPVPDEVKEQRRERFMRVQARISAARLQARIGEISTVLVDAHDEREHAIARSAADAPEIDGIVRVARGSRLAIGEFARVRITGADEHDLTAVTDA